MVVAVDGFLLDKPANRLGLNALGQAFADRPPSLSITLRSFVFGK